MDSEPNTGVQPTAIDHLHEAWMIANAAQGSAGPTRGDAAREFALAKTAIEDAQMRINRGFAMIHGVFQPSDVQKAHS